MQWSEPYIVESEPYIVESHVGANECKVKIRSKPKAYRMNMLKKYIATEPEVDVLPTSDKDNATRRCDSSRY